MARRGGLLIEARDCGVMHGIHIDSLFIHDVNGSLCKSVAMGPASTSIMEVKK